MQNVERFKCESCGMEFFINSCFFLKNNKTKCPFCESKILLPLIAK